MRKDFMEKYSKLAKTSPSILKAIYLETTDNCTEPQDENKKVSQQQIAEFIH